ncbi:hypothetical protein MJC1_03568 [Methylocystis sp. MJC1]|jgi:hypothetical protein|nr:hypothetical protein MJC1_03568 [Methylocystis sp. MJC1]
MESGQIYFGSFRRSFVVGVIVSVFLFQLASFAGATKLSGVGGYHASFEAAVLCSLNGDNDGPAHDDCNHSKCCEHCLVGARVVPVLALAVTFLAILDLLPEKQVIFPGAFDEARPISGRLNSWSSRAPPFFS